MEKLSTKDDGSITVDTGAAKKLTADDKDDVVGFDDVKEDDYVLSAWIGGKLYVEKAESVTGELESVKDKETLTVAGTKYDMSEVVGFTGGEDDVKAPSTYSDIKNALDTEATFYLDANGMVVAMGNVASEVVGFTGGEDDVKAPSTYSDIKNALDTEATFYLDANGMVVAMGNVAENASNYAYVWASDVTGSGIDSNRVKVTLSDGTTKTYTLADKSELPATNITNDLTGENGSTKVQRIYAYSINKDGEIKLTNPKATSDGNVSASFSKNKTKVEGENGSTKVQRIYAYSINKDGEIKLTNPKATSDGNVSASFSKNKTKVEGLTGAKTDYASSSTVFFYVSLDGKKIDDVEVYTGYKNAPGVDSAAAEAAFNSNDKMVAVAFEAADLSRTEKADHLFVTDVITSSSKTTTVKAILPGTSEEVEIKVDDSNWTKENVLCLFSKDSDGVYTLTEVTKEADDDDVKHISSTTVATDSKEYKLTDKTVWIELDSKGGFDTASVGKLPSDSDKETVTSILANNDDEILVIITTEKAEKKPAPEVKDNITVDLDTMSVTYTGKKPTEDEVVAAVQAQLEKEGWTVKSIKNDSGKQYVFTATKGLLEKTGKKPTEDEVVAAVQAQLEKEGWTVKSIKNDSGKQYVFTATKGLLEKSFTLADASAPVEVVTVTVNGAEKQVAKTAQVKDLGLKDGKHVKITTNDQKVSYTVAAPNADTTTVVAGASYEDGFYKINKAVTVESSSVSTELSTVTLAAALDKDVYVKAAAAGDITVKFTVAGSGNTTAAVKAQLTADHGLTVKGAKFATAAEEILGASAPSSTKVDDATFTLGGTVTDDVTLTLTLSK